MIYIHFTKSFFFILHQFYKMSLDMQKGIVIYGKFVFCKCV